MSVIKLYGAELSPEDQRPFLAPDSFVSSAEKNIENMVGAMMIPLGVAGALPIQGDYAEGEYLVPMATTEACLVASVNRGVKAIRQSGGATTQAERVGITRSPVLRVETLHGVEWYEVMLQQKADAMQQAIAQMSRHLKLLSWKVRTNPKNKEVFVHFRFDSADAMGMNMATIATKAVCEQVLSSAFGGHLIAVSSNWCSDKKPAQIHTQAGRGYAVQASVTLLDAVLNTVFHTQADDFLQVYETKILRGSALAGALSQNAHHANMVAAIYAATGQDLAHVVEGSHGRTCVEAVPGGVRVQVELPALVCGTVGGGTKVEGARNVFRHILKLKQLPEKGDQAAEFAEVIGATVLAGEISLLGAIAAKQLASSHDRFRR